MKDQYIQQLLLLSIEANKGITGKYVVLET